MNTVLIALLILLVTVILFIKEPIPIVVTSIAASLAYAYAGIIEVKSVFSGYNSNTIVLLAGMMVIGASLFHTGVTDLIGEKMIKVTGKSEVKIILYTLIVSCLLSSVCSNIGVMVALVPVVTAICVSAGIGPSKAILGLLFGAQFGGFLTLVGVGSNVAAANAMKELGLNPFGFFDITPFGIAVSILGILYFTFIGRKLIPDTGYIPEFATAEKKSFDKKKAMISGFTMIGVLIVIAGNFKAFPMHIASTIGALIIVGAGCMTTKEAIGSIDWITLIIVGALSAISSGVQSSGAGKLVADAIVKFLGSNPSPFMITTAIFFTASVLTQFMSNIPTILLFLPIGVSIANTIGVSPYPIVMTITLAGAASYATPFAAPQNMMTLGWTKYKFMDFVKIGLPMVLITYLAVVAVIPFFLPY
ncbi:MAG: SLC13 family permease [Sedimentibacter sp.]|uniref:SLC13 family permease n=1 Tax=Sedimentibacter sp. TaxID=1960295 RepID=UPI003158DBBD